MKQPYYRDRDITFGQAMLTLRTAIGLTQTSLAEYLGVSRRAIGDWEAGNKYPNGEHLKHFITLTLTHRAFTAGREAEEIRILWDAAHQKVWLNESWLASLLTQSPLKEPQALFLQPEPVTGPVTPLPVPVDNSSSGPRVDWDEALSVPAFYGRKTELGELRRWLVEERCQIVTLLGLGGIGKSALAVTLMHEVAPHFEVVIWRSVRNAPSCESLLDECLQVLAPQHLEAASASLEKRLSYLMAALRKNRVLLVLDNLESLLEEGAGAGQMRKGYDGYGRLLLRVAETVHKSCLLLTSREKPADLIAFEGNRSPVRVLRLSQLAPDACEQLLVDKDVAGTLAERVRLGKIFAGNPLALKIVARTIVDLFDGEIAPFLEQGEIIFGGVRKLLDQHFNRLSPLEQDLLLWLAIMREPTTIEELLAALVTPMPRSMVLEAIEDLRRRSLIEQGQKPGSFTLQSVVLEYAMLRLIAEASDEIKQDKLVRLLRHGFVQAHAKDYVRQSQERLLVAPLLAGLQAGSVGQASLLARFHAYFNELRNGDEDAQGYGPANLVTLIRWQQGDLCGLDLSRLVLRDVYLQGVQMQNTNLSEATIRDSVFTGTTGSIAAMAISRNGEYWVATNMSGEVLVWKAETRTLHHVWQFHNIASRFSLSPDGRTIAIGVQLDGIKLLELDSGKLLRTLVSADKFAYTHEVVFAPDGRKIAATTANALVQLWDAETGRELQTLPHPNEVQIPVLMWNPDGGMLASGDVKGVIRLWEIPEIGPASCVQTFTGHTQEVVGLTFSPDGLTLASASWDGTVKLWEVSSGQLQQTLTGHKDRVSRVAWSPDGLTLASGGRDSDPSIWLWDVEQATYRAVLLGHHGVIRGLTFTSDSASLLSCGEDGTVRLWDVVSGQCILVLESYRFNPYVLDWSPDSTRLVNNGSDSMITIYDVTGNLPPRSLQGTRDYFAEIRWSPDGRWIVASEIDDAIRLWDAETGEFLNFFEEPGVETGYLSFDIEWSPDSRWLASATDNHGIIMWNVLEYRQSWIIKPLSTEIYTIDWHPDGTWLAGSGGDGTLYIWDAITGTLMRRLTDKLFINNLVWSPDGALLAATENGPDGSMILVWNTRGWERVTSFGGQSGIAHKLAWGQNEAILISGDAEGNLSWWNVQTGECLRICKAHLERINSLVRSPDGSKLASSGNDGNIKVWNINTGELLQTIKRDPPYERLNITGIKGLTEAQKATLRALGAFEL